MPDHAHSQGVGGNQDDDSAQSSGAVYISTDAARASPGVAWPGGPLSVLASEFAMPAAEFAVPEREIAVLR